MKKKREENVELADIQAVRERMTQWAIRLWLLLIPVIVGIILSTQGESTGWTICRLMTCANIWRRREPRWIWGR